MSLKVKAILTDIEETCEEMLKLSKSLRWSDATDILEIKLREQHILLDKLLDDLGFQRDFDTYIDYVEESVNQS